MLGIIGLISADANNWRNESEIIGFIAILFLGFSFIAFLVYILKKSKYFTIEYAGGYIMSSCNWYSNKAIKTFMKKISVQKDKL